LFDGKVIKGVSVIRVLSHKDVADKLTAAGAQGIGKNIADSILESEGNPYDAALRVFRTELNRAHGEAYQAAAFAHLDVIGTRFLLSPNHPRHDICDMHAHANVHGLGPGVYPKSKNPWPAHPNTLSYVEVVFDDSVGLVHIRGKALLQLAADANAGAPDRLCHRPRTGACGRAQARFEFLEETGRDHAGC
jgi:hypothetical protein